MATLTVQPADDGYDMNQNWEVTGRGKITSHTHKEAAKNEADRRAHDGDTKIIKGTNGQVINRLKHRGSRESESETSSPMPSSPNKYGEATRQIGVQDFFK